MGIRGRDGVLLVVETSIGSKLFVPNANSRVCNVDDWTGFAASGVYPDSRSLLKFSRDQAHEFYEDSRDFIPTDSLIDRVAQYVHQFSLSVHRPYGCAAFYASWDEKEGGHLYLVEPSGLCYEYTAWSIGKHRQGAKAELEKLKLAELSDADLMREAARIMLTVRDESKDKNTRLEMGWVGRNTGGRFRPVSDDKVKEAETWAKRRLEEEESDEEMG